MEYQAIREGGSPVWNSRASGHDLFVGVVSDYPHLEYSMKSVRRAGKSLRGEIDWNAKDRDAVLATFAVANSWRNSHVLPMRSIRFSVIQRMRNARINGVTAARSKRMTSIRKKLRRIGCQLDQIQDLGGCRAIVDDIAGVNALIAECSDRVPHDLKREYPYIEEPKDDGYRCHHMVYKYCGKDDRAHYQGRRIELQIRTRLQHSWATAVEAVGLYRGEDLKAGLGDARWLRLFLLMSAEFAHVEGCATPPGVSGRPARIREIRELNAELRAAGFLDSLRDATHYVDTYLDTREARYYLIKYDHANREVSVTVKTYSSAVEGSASFGEAEQEIEIEGTDAKVVLVEVDKVDALTAAYPNYFGDVSLFIGNLRLICEGAEAVEYSMAPQQVVAPKPHEKPDDSWLRRRIRRWD